MSLRTLLGYTVTCRETIRTLYRHAHYLHGFKISALAYASHVNIPLQRGTMLVLFVFSFIIFSIAKHTFYHAIAPTQMMHSMEMQPEFATLQDQTPNNSPVNILLTNSSQNNKKCRVYLVPDLTMCAHHFLLIICVDNMSRSTFYSHALRNRVLWTNRELWVLHCLVHAV